MVRARLCQIQEHAAARREECRARCPFWFVFRFSSLERLCEPALTGGGVPGRRHQIHFVLLISRQGKTRLAKYFTTMETKEKQRIQHEVANLVLARPSRLCNFVEWQKYKIVYKRYAAEGLSGDGV